MNSLLFNIHKMEDIMEVNYLKGCDFEITIDNNETLSLFVDIVRFETTEDKQTLVIYFNASEEFDIFKYLKDNKAHNEIVNIKVKSMNPEHTKGFVVTDSLYALKEYQCDFAINDSEIVSVFTKWEA